MTKGDGMSGSVRIIGGEWRGRRLRLPAAAAVRPTPDRIRETVFNWLGAHIIGCDCLDLYAGSGAFGFEALSRGARSVVFVENDARLAAALNAHADSLHAQSARVVRKDATAFLRGRRRSAGHDPGSVASPTDRRAEATLGVRRYGMIFLDPPYTTPLEPLVGPVLDRLAGGGMIYVERAAADGLPEHDALHWRRRGRAGRVAFGLAVAA